MLRRKFIVAAVAITSLALPVAASAKVVTYAGTLEGDGKIALDVKVSKKKSKPKKIVEARGTELDLQCEQSGELPGYASFTDPIKVKKNGKYEGTFEQPQYGNESSIAGKFKGKGKKKTTGTFVFDFHFLADDEFPEEDCTTGEVEFTAKSGATDETQPFPPPERR